MTPECTGCVSGGKSILTLCRSNFSKSVKLYIKRKLQNILWPFDYQPDLDSFKPIEKSMNQEHPNAFFAHPALLAIFVCLFVIRSFSHLQAHILQNLVQKRIILTLKIGPKAFLPSLGK